MAGRKLPPLGPAPTVTLQIATYQHDEHLCQTLRCALAQTYPNLEILVVDQSPGRPPATRAFLGEMAGRIRYVQTSPASIPQARNLGVELARGEIVLRIDDDVVFAPDFVENHVSYYREDPSIAGVAGHVEMDPPGRPFIPQGQYASDATGCNLSCRRDVIFEVGGYDPRFSGYAIGEDTDFVRRLRRQGFRLANGHRARLHHHGGGAHADKDPNSLDGRRWLSDYFRNLGLAFGKRFPGAPWLLPLFLLKNWRVYGRYVSQARDKRAFLRFLLRCNLDAFRLARQPAPRSFLRKPEELAPGSPGRSPQP
jgi:GT2 family glycosyltransferase